MAPHSAAPKSIEQLVKLAEIHTPQAVIPFIKWCDTTTKLFEKAAKCLKDGDREEAYIHFLQVSSIIIEILPQHADFKHYKKDPLYTSLRERLGKYFANIEQLKVKLKEEYDEYHKERDSGETPYSLSTQSNSSPEADHASIKTSSSSKGTSVEPHASPKTLPIIPKKSVDLSKYNFSSRQHAPFEFLDSYLKDFIEAETLAILLRKYSRSILFIDLRSSKNREQVFKSDNLVYFPQTLFANGQVITSTSLESSLSLTKKDLFNRRNTFELIVFFDEDSSSLTDCSVESKFMFNELVNSIFHMEFNSVPKRKPLLLKGGFKHFRDIAPEFIATNSEIEETPANRPIAEPITPRKMSLPLPATTSMSYPSVSDPAIKSTNSLGTALRLPDLGIFMKNDNLSASISYPNIISSPVIPPKPLMDRKPPVPAKIIPIKPSAVIGKSSASPLPSTGDSKRYADDIISLVPTLMPKPASNGGIQKKLPTAISSLPPPKKPSPPLRDSSKYSVPVAHKIPPIPQREYASVHDRELMLRNFTEKYILSPQLSSKSSFSAFGVTGLKNLGNTCFMNSIIQCVNSYSQLTRYFLSGEFRKNINTCNTLGTGGIIAEATYELWKSMWSGEYNVYSPNNFKQAVCKFADRFEGDDQHDSQEFLAFFLDGLHEDLNWVTSSKALSIKEDDNLLDSVRADIEWKAYLERNFSIIVGLFQGQLRSMVTCSACGKTSSTFNTFMFLSLPIVPMASHSRYFTLQSCIEGFLAPEILDASNSWYCPRCKGPRAANKKLDLWRLPPVLIFHIKRFSYQGPFRDKIDQTVDFPIEGFDMADFVSSERLRQQNNASSIYDLFAVSNHYGNLSGGHYKALGRAEASGQWHEFDDSRVTPISKDFIIKERSAAYILFYKRRQ